MVAEEHDDASSDDVEPGLLLPQHPAEPSSSSPALPMAAAAAAAPPPRLIHPGQINEHRLRRRRWPGELRGSAAQLATSYAGSWISGSACATACGQVTAPPCRVI